MGGQQWGAAGWKPIRDPPLGALQEPPFPSETCQGNKTVFGGEEAGKGKEQEVWKVWLKLLLDFILASNVITK